MKKRILKELKTLGRTKAQLRKSLNATNGLNSIIFNKAFKELKKDGLITKLMGGYYMIEVA